MSPLLYRVSVVREATDPATGRVYLADEVTIDEGLPDEAAAWTALTEYARQQGGFGSLAEKGFKVLIEAEPVSA
jgi:hypothetical protein